MAGFNSSGINRAPAFQTTLAFPLPQVVPTKLQAETAQVLARATVLPSRDNIQVTVEKNGSGSLVVLRGEVADSRERRLAESLIRLTPGVHDVRNDLVVRPPAPAAAEQ
jgi:osmotically-inducible protein OsmY